MSQNNICLYTCAVDEWWLREEYESAQVWEEDSPEEDVAELAARGHDDRGPVVEDEHKHNLQERRGIGFKKKLFSPI